MTSGRLISTGLVPEYTVALRVLQPVTDNQRSFSSTTLCSIIIGWKLYSYSQLHIIYNEAPVSKYHTLVLSTIKLRKLPVMRATCWRWSTTRA